MVLSIIVVFTSVFIIYFFTRYKFCSYNRGLDYSISYSALQLVNYIAKYIVPILLLAILFGFRYDIGVDYFSYKEIYETSFSGNLRQSITESGVEYIYALISHLLYHAGAPYYIMFFVMALIPMCFFTAAFKEQQFLIVYALFFLASTGVLFWFFNIQRQGIAFFILLYSLKYIKEKKLGRFLLCVAIASGFHISSVLFVFCYIFTYFKPSTLFNPIILGIIYIAFIIFAPYLREILIDIVSVFLTGKYSYYVNSIQTWEMSIGSGLGILSMHVIDLVLILSARSLCNYYSEYRYDIYFRIFFVGTLFANIASTNMVLSRFPFCFVSMRAVLLSFAVYYVIHNWKNIRLYKKIIWCGIIGLSILLLIGNAYNNPYEFVPSL